MTCGVGSGVGVGSAMKAQGFAESERSVPSDALGDVPSDALCYYMCTGGRKSRGILAVSESHHIPMV